jgi:hypothetical protein
MDGWSAMTTHVYVHVTTVDNTSLAAFGGRAFSAGEWFHQQMSKRAVAEPSGSFPA